MVHPFQKWLDQQSLTYEQAAERCEKLGRKTSADYLKQFAQGYYCPSSRFCSFIAGTLCKGQITLKQIARYPYTLRGCSWAAVA